ncbi:alpha/beta fold hydrolase [Larsenimonas rhizosphaerae]|uniref:alpha/beta fold hydrolase n=1 Tax=Larsenimonas rhizosphaerae TaxID=2944682 RepID=UPI0020341FF9|nr:alpha/beta hydrolase [Larsenimonas rhizosphaerae]MCM2131984.1 alpha/beta hydrolase [Larsenimonas rhizosphaerae]
MAKGWQQLHGRMARVDQCVYWQRLVRAEGDLTRPLLLLHGAGLSGAVCWGGLLPHLSRYRDVLIPDLRGAGRTVHPGGRDVPFSMADVIDDISELLDQQQIADMDIAGYSFGGLAAMLLKARLGERIHHMTLLEPALLERMDRALTIRVRDEYSAAARIIREGESPVEGVGHFLDLISPHRTRDSRVEEVAVRRLARRHEGFAHALDCVTAAISTTCRETLLSCQHDVISVVGGNSPQSMKDYHHHLAETRTGWSFHELPDTDHSLPFQKPRFLAGLIERRISADNP